MRRVFALALLLGGCRGSLDATQPGPPEQVRVAVAAGAAEVYWSTVPSATSFALYVAPGPGVTPENYDTLGGFRTPSTNHRETLTGLTPGQVYSVVVCAVIGGRERPPSPRIEFRMNEGSEWIAPPDLVLSTSGTQSRFGGALASADLDADGYDDLVIGSPGASSKRGRVSVYQGGPSGLRFAWSVPGGTADELGHSVAAGDTNGDGFADVLAGAPGGSKALLWRGAEQLPFTPPTFSRTGTPGARYGLSVGLMGDGRFAVAETGAADGVVLGYDGMTLGTAWRLTLPGGGPEGPRLPAHSPDFDADGVPDVAVGSPGEDGTSPDSGIVHVWLGDVVSGAAPTWSNSPNGVDGYGERLEVLDHDGDGFDDVFVAAPLTSGSAGFAQIHFGDGGGISGATDTWFGAGNDRLGAALARVPDADFDGTAEAAIGLPGDDFQETDGGIVLGVMSDGDEVFVPGLSADLDFAVALAGGDLNGDGVGDIAAGSPLDGNGSVSIFYGRATIGPWPSAGFTIRGIRETLVEPAGASFSDPVRTTHTCEWYWGVDPNPTVISPCTPGGAGAVLHVFSNPGRHDVRLRVIAADGRWAEAATVAIIE